MTTASASPALARALERHCNALGACRRCAFDDVSILPVSSASRRPLAMLIGQAPGKTEQVDRRPFAGRAGKTMFRWLADAGITERVARDRIYIAAITRCYPGPSPSGRGDRVPSPREIANCTSWLDDEIALICPAVLVPVGRLAIERFLDAAPLSALVGRAHTVMLPHGPSIVIPLPHPSGASSWIHGPGNRARVRRAVGLLAARVPALVAESALRDAAAV